MDDFNHNNQYGDFIEFKSLPNMQDIEYAKELLLEHSKMVVPEQFQNSVKIIETHPDDIREFGTIGWKYSPQVDV